MGKKPNHRAPPPEKKKRSMFGAILTVLVFGGVFGGTAAMVGVPTLGRCNWLIEKTAALEVTDQMVDAIRTFLEPVRPLATAVGKPLIGGGIRLCKQGFPQSPCSIPEGLPVTAKLPFVDAEFVVALMALYVGAVAVFKIVFGALHMIERFKTVVDLLCKIPLVVHNVVLVGLSAFMAFGTLRQMVLGNFTFWGNSVKGDGDEALARLVWIFYLSKIPEFLDTIFMIVKGNSRQVSFLHVYHHGSVLGVAWLYVMYAPNGDTALPVFLNSAVHTIMYTYYAAALCKIPLPIQKFTITYMQLLQFLTMVIQQGLGRYNDWQGYPSGLSYFFIFYILSMIMLFSNFLMANKSTPKPKQA